MGFGALKVSRSTPAHVLIGAYLIVSSALLASAGYLYLLRCEGMACLGVAIGWMAWACIYALVLILGITARHQARKHGVLPRLSSGVLWVQCVVGVVLLCIWLRFRFS